MCYLRFAVHCRVLIYQCIVLFLLAWEAMFTKTSWKAKHHHRVTTLCFGLHWNDSHCLQLKADFHMIADDRGSRIADHKKFCDRMRSYGEKHFCDCLRSIADCAIKWQPNFCYLRWNVSHNILNSDPLVTRNLWRKLRDMGAFTTVINSKYFKDKNKKAISGKISGRNLIYQQRRRRSNAVVQHMNCVWS